MKNRIAIPCMKSVRDDGSRNDHFLTQTMYIMYVYGEHEIIAFELDFDLVYIFAITLKAYRE